MKQYIKCLLAIVGILFLATSCEDVFSTSCSVGFKNNSASKTVYPVWDGGRAATLAPGQTSEYRTANPGTHTIQWKNAANNQDLTSMAWPNLVDGRSYTFPYND